MPGLPLNPLLRAGATYPFQRLTAARELLRERDPEAFAGLVDLGAGEPREPVPGLVRRALVAAVEEEDVSGYPLAAGLPELRAAICAWVGRRYDVALDPARHVLPSLGAKELVFLMALAFVDRPGGRDLVGVPEPAYPVYEQGAAFAGADVLRLPLRADRGFLPDLDAITAEQWSRLALLWLNYPNNPTAAVAPASWYAEAAARCAEHGVILASDEAYSELWFHGDAPASLLQTAPDGDGLTGRLVVNTLSKRSSVPGYRSGFVAGDPELVGALRRFRPSVGVAPQRFVQLAAAAAWGDEGHVDEARERYRRKLDLLQPGLDALGLVSAGGDGSFFRWLAVPDGWRDAPWARRSAGDPLVAELRDVLLDTEAGRDDAAASSAAFAAALLRHGVVVAPGGFFGPAGEGYVRAAVVPTAEACGRAAERLVALAG